MTYSKSTKTIKKYFRNRISFSELDNSVEGLIRVENMTDDYYEYDEKVNTLTGRRKQKSYTTGDVVNIVVARLIFFQDRLTLF